LYRAVVGGLVENPTLVREAHGAAAVKEVPRVDAPFDMLVPSPRESAETESLKGLSSINAPVGISSAECTNVSI